MAGRPKKEVTEEVENKTTTTVNDDKEMIKELLHNQTIRTWNMLKKNTSMLKRN